MWENPTATEHTVTHTGCLENGDHCAFDSGLMLPTGTFALPGLAPGQYPYICRIHPIMRGVITVTEASHLPSQT
jgi:plastocyanin